MFSSTKKFKFYCSVPGVIENFPIIPAKSYRPLWVKSAIETYKNASKNINSTGLQLSGVIKCPGIADLSRVGWIMPAWFDFIIETKGKDQGRWIVNSNLPVVLDCVDGFNKDLITFIDMSNPLNQIPLSTNTYNGLIKVSSPWVVDIPKGWNLLIKPVSYSDDVRFESSCGLLKPGKHVEINPQLFWNVLYGKELVKAGTPLIHLVPIPDKAFSIGHECLQFDEKRKYNQLAYFYEKALSFIR